MNTQNPYLSLHFFKGAILWEVRFAKVLKTAQQLLSFLEKRPFLTGIIDSCCFLSGDGLFEFYNSFITDSLNNEHRQT